MSEIYGKEHARKRPDPYIKTKAYERHRKQDRDDPDNGQNMLG